VAKDEVVSRGPEHGKMKVTTPTRDLVGRTGRCQPSPRACGVKGIAGGAIGPIDRFRCATKQEEGRGLRPAGPPPPGGPPWRGRGLYRDGIRPCR